MNIFKKYTVRSLLKNKVRTIVTIIGIILSTAMLTAVTTTVSSLQDFMIRVVTENNGCWHLCFQGVEEENIKVVKEETEAVETTIVKNVGYAQIEDAWQMYRPYLYIGAYEGDLQKMCAVHIAEGRMPQNSNEIILPNNLDSSGEESHKLGENVTLSIGVRRLNEKPLLWQDSTVVFTDKEETLAEEWEEKESRQFTVVGFYEGSMVNQDDMPGYTLFTKADGNITTYASSLYLTIPEPKEAVAVKKKTMAEIGQEGMEANTNSSYLLYTGNSSNDTITGMIGGLMAILIGIIMFGSISLIYNSFSITINERKREFGLLSSVGATKKQLKRSVLFESVLLSAIGVPIGVLAGIGGMGVTFYALSDTFQQFLAVENSQAITLQVSASLFAVLLAGIIGFLTVLISAWLPVRKALKIPAIEAIRQTQDIHIRSKNLKTSKLTQKVFGLAGMLGSKNFKRNKKKYRATVFSLFISVVLFISASSFCDYLASGMGYLMHDFDFDIAYNVHMDTLDEDVLKSGEKLVQAEGVSETACLVVDGSVDIVMKNSQLHEKYLEDRATSLGNEKALPDEIDAENGIYSQLVFVEDAAYRKYLQENGLDEKIYMDTDKPAAIALDELNVWDENGGVKEVYHVLKETSFDTVLYQNKELEGDYEVSGENNEGDGKFKVRISEFKEEGDEYYEVESSVKNVTPEEAYHATPIHVGTVLSTPPLGVDMLMGNAVILLYPDSARKTISKNNNALEYMRTFRSTAPDKTYQEVNKMLNQSGNHNYSIVNIYEMLKITKGIMLVIKVFSYGFIILISLIALANVFNTISTNISLRRREFAMLRSVGMTQSGFYKMMNYECLLYGFKGILYGVPAAIGITYLIYKAMSGGILRQFYIPWYSVAIAVGSVFVVVFATMLYAMSKIRKDNVVETLKNENY